MTEFARMFLGSYHKPDAEYQFYYERWLEYYRRTELFDRILSPKTGLPIEGHHLGVMNANARKVKIDIFGRIRKEMGATERVARDSALTVVENEYSD